MGSLIFGQSCKRVAPWYEKGGIFSMERANLSRWTASGPARQCRSQNRFATPRQNRKLFGELSRQVKSHRNRSRIRLNPKPASA